MLIDADSSLGMLIDCELEHIGPCVVSRDVEIILAASNFARVDLGRHYAFFVEQPVCQDLPERADDAATATHEDGIGCRVAVDCFGV